jgi:hypothetical protein
MDEYRGLKEDVAVLTAHCGSYKAVTIVYAVKI